MIRPRTLTSSLVTWHTHVLVSGVNMDIVDIHQMLTRKSTMPSTCTGAESVDTTYVVNVLIEGFMFGIVSCVKNDP